MPPSGQLFLLAESEGFEPPVPQSGTTDFESAPFDHSGSSPCNCKNRKILEEEKESDAFVCRDICLRFRAENLTENKPFEQKADWIVRDR
jgi:hypothetical protein